MTRAGADMETRSAGPGIQGGRLDERVVINPHAHVIHCGDDELLVKHGSRSLYSEVIVDEKRTRLIGKVVRELAQPGSVNELVARNAIDGSEAEMAMELVDYLRDRGVLVDPAADIAHVYLDTMLGDPGPASARVRETSLGLVGAGPLGARIARTFAHLHPKKIVALDDRAVSDRQGLSGYLDLAPNAVRAGSRFAECLVDHFSSDGYKELTRIAGDATDGAALGGLFEQTDFVVAAWESPSPNLFHAVNEAAIATETPWLAVFLDGSVATVGPLFVPGETGCYYEFEIETESAVLMKDEYMLYKEHLRETTAGDLALALPPYLDVAAGFAATAALRFLATGASFATNRALRVDFERLAVDYQEVLRFPRCPACAAQRPSYRHLFL